MIKIQPEKIEVQIANASKPQALSNFSYPLNSLDDRIFEILTYTVFKKRIIINDRELTPIYDDVLLMQGVGEKGMDCVLTKNNKFAAFIQCKKYSKNLNEKQILLELIKFCIHFINNRQNFTYQKKFKYYIAASTGFSGGALTLLEKFTTKKGIKSLNIREYIDTNIRKYQEFKNLKLETIEAEVESLLLSFSYEYFSPGDYNLWINGFPEIIETFFEIKKVTDNSDLKKSTKEIIEKIDNSNKINLQEETNIFGNYIFIQPKPLFVTVRIECIFFIFRTSSHSL